MSLLKYLEEAAKRGTRNTTHNIKTFFFYDLLWINSFLLISWIKAINPLNLSSLCFQKHAQPSVPLLTSRRRSVFSYVSRILYAAFLPSVLASISETQKRQRNPLEEWREGQLFCSFSMSNITLSKKRNGLCLRTILSQPQSVLIQCSEGYVCKSAVHGRHFPSSLGFGTQSLVDDARPGAPFPMLWPRKLQLRLKEPLLTHILKCVL